MDQSVPVRYVFILYESESDNTSKHYTVILIILFYVFLCGIILNCLSIYLWHHFTDVFYIL